MRASMPWKRRRSSRERFVGGLTVANVDCAYDPCAVSYAQLCIVAANDHDRDRDDCRTHAVFTAGQLLASQRCRCYFAVHVRFWQGIRRTQLVKGFCVPSSRLAMPNKLGTIASIKVISATHSPYVSATRKCERPGIHGNKFNKL